MRFLGPRNPIGEPKDGSRPHLKETRMHLQPEAEEEESLELKPKAQPNSWFFLFLNLLELFFGLAGALIYFLGPQPIFNALGLNPDLTTARLWTYYGTIILTLVVTEIIETIVSLRLRKAALASKLFFLAVLLTAPALMNPKPYVWTLILVIVPGVIQGSEVLTSAFGAWQNARQLASLLEGANEITGEAEANQEQIDDLTDELGNCRELFALLHTSASTENDKRAINGRLKAITALLGEDEEV